MIALSVNVNKIAWLRNSRDSSQPDPVDFALAAIHCGANGITVHPRPDLRHITPQDVRRLKKAIAKKVEFNIEGNPYSKKTAKYTGFLPLIREVLPEQCTLVPDSNQQKTSDHGWDLQKNFSFLQEVIAELKELKVRSSLFMDADNQQWDLLEKIAPHRIELYTGPFAFHFQKPQEKFYWDTLVLAAKKASSLGIGINAGHDLNLENLAKIKQLKNLQEVSIGQALVCEALQEGWSGRIQKYLSLLR